MTYLIDHNLPPRLAKILLACDVEAHTVADEFGANADDPVWLPEAAGRGWVVVTADKGIRKRREENVCFRDSGLVAVFVPQAMPGATLLAKMAWFLSHLDRAERVLAKARQGTKVHIGGGGAILVWSAGAGRWVKPSEARA